MNMESMINRMCDEIKQNMNACRNSLEMSHTITL